MIDCQSDISRWKRLEASLAADRRLSVGLLDQAQKNAARAKEMLKNAEAAKAILQSIAKSVQEQAHQRITDIVNKCLQEVFDDPYEFKILFEEKRGRTEAVLVFERDGVQLNPMDDTGGGVIDIASFALRLSCLLLSNPPLRKVLILDEPFKWVAKKYLGRVKTLLEKLATDLEVQIIMVTHIEELHIGQVIEIE